MSSSNNNDNTAARTIRLNVGGTIYEVSKSLLNQYPDTMLARMVSDTWNGVDDEDDDRIETTNDPMFIDRNGERFQYVLDYMRDSPKVVPLPVTVSKDSVLNDLEYFGFEDVSPDSFSLTSSYAVYKITLDQMNVLDEKLSSKNKLDHNSSQLAHYCFLRFKFSGKLNVDMSVHCKEDFHRPTHSKYNDYEFLQQVTNFALTLKTNQYPPPPVKATACFNKYLGEYGLKFQGSEDKGRGVHPITIILEIAK